VYLRLAGVAPLTDRVRRRSAAGEVFDHAAKAGERSLRPPMPWPSVLKRDDLRMNHHRALAICLRMFFSENRCTLFRIML
jgi:hypothetical protein